METQKNGWFVFSMFLLFLSGVYFSGEPAVGWTSQAAMDEIISKSAEKHVLEDGVFFARCFARCCTAAHFFWALEFWMSLCLYIIYIYISLNIYIETIEGCYAWSGQTGLFCRAETSPLFTFHIFFFVVWRRSFLETQTWHDCNTLSLSLSKQLSKLIDRTFSLPTVRWNKQPTVQETQKCFAIHAAKCISKILWPMQGHGHFLSQSCYIQIMYTYLIGFIQLICPHLQILAFNVSTRCIFKSSSMKIWVYMGGFLKWWVSPTNPWGFSYYKWSWLGVWNRGVYPTI